MALRIAHGFFRLWLLVSVIWILIAGPFMWWVLVNPTLNHEKWSRGPGDSEWMVIDPKAGFKPMPLNSAPKISENALVIKPTAKHTLIEAITWLVLMAFGPPALVLVIGLALGWTLRGFFLGR
jgi:hypothetical protein